MASRSKIRVLDLTFRTARVRACAVRIAFIRWYSVVRAERKEIAVSNSARGGPGPPERPQTSSGWLD